MVRARPWRTALAIASREIRSSASRQSAETSTSSARSRCSRAPTRFAMSSAACPSARSSGSSIGRFSAAIAPRDSSSARSTASMTCSSGSGVSRTPQEPAHLRGDEGQLLRDAVVQVARHPPSLLEHRRADARRLLARDLANRADEQRRDGREEEEVAAEEQLGELRGEQRVVDERDRGDHRADAQPLQELVVLLLREAGEPDRRHREADGRERLGHDQRRVLAQQLQLVAGLGHVGERAGQAIAEQRRGDDDRRQDGDARAERDQHAAGASPARAGRAARPRPRAAASRRPRPPRTSTSRTRRSRRSPRPSSARPSRGCRGRGSPPRRT